MIPWYIELALDIEAPVSEQSNFYKEQEFKACTFRYGTKAKFYIVL